MKKSNIFNEGRQARSNNYSSENCSYWNESSQRAHWLRGWNYQDRKIMMRWRWPFKKKSTRKTYRMYRMNKYTGGKDYGKEFNVKKFINFRLVESDGWKCEEVNNGKCKQIDIDEIIL